MIKYLPLLLLFCSTALADVQEGKTLTQSGFYDEALVVLKPIETAETSELIDLLFYRGCCNFHLLNKDAAIRDLEAVLRLNNLPRRYFHLTHRMLAEIKPLKEDTLDEISRLMKDAGRRVQLGDTGNRVQTQQQLIIDKLDKLIKETEEQQKQQQAMAQAQGSKQSKGSASPLKDSEIKDTKGDGDAQRKSMDLRNSWGKLPPKERGKILQKLGPKLPTHYQDAIHAYMRKLATGGQ